jgi:hypothetical protein
VVLHQTKRKQKNKDLGMVVHTYNPNTGGMFRQEDLESQASLSYIVKPCLKIQTN